MANIIVTGGAGYIGSMLVKVLCNNGYCGNGNRVIVFDNLYSGKKEMVDKRAGFFNVDLRERINKRIKADVIIHLASYKSVNESMSDAKKYSDNIRMTMNILDYGVNSGIKKFIFSSSAAVYGNPKYVPIDENHPLKPINYYGETKLISEKIVEWYSRIYGFKHVIFRYFNVIGDPLGFRERGENILPSIMDVVEGRSKYFTIFGNRYKTKDGTAIRDYIDVRDIARAHVLGINKGEGIINLGSGKGCSVKEILSYFNINVRTGKRRKGDPAVVVASNKKARKMLGWKQEITLKESIGSYLNKQ